jgi:cell division septation protein DedD
MTQNRGDEQRSRRRGEKGDAPTEQEKKEQRKRDKAILNGVLDYLRGKAGRIERGTDVSGGQITAKEIAVLVWHLDESEQKAKETKAVMADAADWMDDAETYIAELKEEIIDLRHKLLKGVRERMVATPIEVEDEAPAAETPTEQPASPTAAEQMADASFIENPPKPEPPAQPTAEPGASSSLLHLPGMTPFLGLTDYYE